MDLGLGRGSLGWSRVDEPEQHWLHRQLVYSSNKKGREDDGASCPIME
jgi:hypothetical protein